MRCLQIPIQAESSHSCSRDGDQILVSEQSGYDPRRTHKHQDLTLAPVTTGPLGYQRPGGAIEPRLPCIYSAARLERTG